MGRARRVAIAVKTWSGEECVFVWNWAKKYFIQVRQLHQLCVWHTLHRPHAAAVLMSLVISSTRPVNNESYLSLSECAGMQTGRDRDWLYIVHINNGKIKGDWKKSGPTIPDLDRALQGYSYDIVELQGDSVAGSLVAWTGSEDIDILIVGSGKSGPGRRLPNPIQNRTTDWIAANATCATLVIHPKVRP